MISRTSKLALMLAVVLPACAVTGLSFVQDDRVRIVEPEPNAKLSLPFEVRWDVEGYDGSFAVFIDRSPVKPNQTLEALVPERDTVCRTDPDCPDAEWLADRNVYVTTDTSLMLEHLPDRRENDSTGDRHELTIVLLDEDGRRSGESAFTREFLVERDD